MSFLSSPNDSHMPLAAPFSLKIRSLPLILFFLLALPCVVFAQKDSEDDVVRVDTNLVILNVTVTDNQGRFVRKIPRSDFKVFEDGHEQTVDLFSVEETPFAAAILLDTSGSMEGRITLGRAAAIRFLDGLRGEDVAAIYHFNNKVERLQDYSPGRDLPSLAYQLRPKGSTTLNDAIFMAAQDLAGRPEKRRAIVVLSDGADTKSSASPDKALSAALAANATIYTVNMMDTSTRRSDQMLATGALQNFASKSGGTYVATPGGQALGDAFGKIIEELRNQYTISYRPTNRARDGRWRTIELKLSRTDLNVRTRKGYRAPKS